MNAIVKIYLIAVCAIFGFAAGAGLTGSSIAAFCISLVVGGAAAFLFNRFQIVSMEQSACSRPLKVVSVVAMIVGIIQLTRLLVFIVVPSQGSYSVFPSSQWMTRHSCFSAYFFALHHAPQVSDIYNEALYSADSDPNSPRKPKMIGRFGIDVFEYPPPFLLLPGVVKQATPDFFRGRMLWFGLNGVVILFGMLIVARSLGTIATTRAILLLPLALASLPFLDTMQKGNIQLTIITMSMLAMVLFSRQQSLSGGTLLAYAAASKIYPGMLVIYLIVRRQWRALAFSTIIGILLALITWMIFGWQTYAAFLNHLPSILGGEAFPALRNPAAIAINHSVPGLIFKLKLFGVSGMGFAESKMVGWVFTLVLVSSVIALAQRSIRTGSDHPIVWLVILIVSTLRSPFLPQGYASFPSIWLLTLVAASAVPTVRTIFLVVLVWLGLNVVIPQDWGFAPRTMALMTLVPQLITFTLPLVAVRQWWRATVSQEALADGEVIPQTVRVPEQ